MNGSFYGEDPELPVMVNNPNQETDLIINRSAIVTNTAAGGSSVSAQGYCCCCNRLMQMRTHCSMLDSLTQEQHDKLMAASTKQDVFNASQI